MGEFRPRLYLRNGDRVLHLRHRQWGLGEVMEEKHSVLPDGTCMVHMAFEGGMERTSINDPNSFARLRLDRP